MKENGVDESSENESFHHHDDEAPFFADITLDLAEAHDIAETPEPSRKEIINNISMKDMPRMPPIADEKAIASDASLSPKSPLNEPSFDDDKPFRSIANNPVSGMRTFPSMRRLPRDVQWAAAFCIIVPLCLLLPMIFSPSKAKAMGTEIWIATAPAPRLATLHTLLWGYGAALVLSRLLYRTVGGGDGDDARHRASQILLLSAPISVSVYLLLVIVMYFMLPNALLYLIIPLWYLARDIFVFRSWKVTATTPGGRQAFFQALTCMTLDILSRSLRRSSFYRTVSLLVVVQLFVIGWWRWALLAAFKSQSIVWIFMALLGGKWATGTVARLLTLIAAGGIHSWFAEQDALVQEVEGGRTVPRDDNEEDNEDMIEFTELNGSRYASTFEDDPDQIPEAYRTADASAYRSSIGADDEGIDDDFEDEDEDEDYTNNNFMDSRQKAHAESRATTFQGSAVKQLLFVGLTRSFGSVAKCGLLGGMAQFLWSQLRKIDTARATFGDLQGMSIGRPQDDEMSWWQKLTMYANLSAREFVRNNSDMAMSHVAAFTKSYQRAAQDVAILIDESGVEPMIHEDISTHMGSCVGGSISGIIVMFTGFVLVHQRNKNHPQITDSAVFLDILMAFVLCYTLIFTVMEPLRASIKAVYVSFAQYPHALSRSFPLIYHRLKRMSESNLQ